MHYQKKTISILRGSLFIASLGITWLMAVPLAAQSAHVVFDAATKVFRLDAGASSYVFGVNPRGELQQIYWGGRLADSDAIPQPQPMREWAAFDSSYNNTPEEYAG